MQAVRVERQIGGRTLSIETGSYAKLAGGAVTVQYGDTVVFGAVARANPREGEYRLVLHAAHIAIIDNIVIESSEDCSSGRVFSAVRSSAVSPPRASRKLTTRTSPF